MKKCFLIGLCAIVFSGCGLLPYKTDYTCPNAIGGSCGNALRSYNSALNDVYGNKHNIDDSEYVNIKTKECIGCKGVSR
ncbi:MAG: hypothetical protein U5K55_14710 [Aliarcobacter sp.]|nr:hypothetical protein [Aliarcobacter sp.]